ncbi:hypothetical protein PG997_012195 [Apiospora hydei]|uniref:DUF7908 domain-containing protein n=1 Tax=Apiospora hydei TaxID=1337664 RepID=A0ABR1V632_9PEZI
MRLEVSSRSEAPSRPVVTVPPFNITTQGQLTSDGRIVSTRPGDVFIPLAPSDDERGISTAFVVIDSVFHWRNVAFAAGEAGFCQVDGSGRVYATFAEQDTWPPGCRSISIIIYKGKKASHESRNSSSA